MTPETLAALEAAKHEKRPVVLASLTAHSAYCPTHLPRRS
jgi:hypothetical protein